MAGDAVVQAFEARRAGALARSRLWTLGGLLVFSALFWGALWASEFFAADLYADDPMAGVARFFARMNPDLEWDRLGAGRDVEGSLGYWLYDLPRWARSLLISIEMAIVGTVVGGALGFIASVFAARTVMPWLVVRASVRRVLEIIRTIPDFILALFLVQAFGSGPLPGLIAITVSTAAGLGRIFIEATENADMAGAEAVRAAGGGWAQQIRYGVLPQIAPNHLSFAFITFEGNVGRAATLGIVGAGGIGMELQRALAFNQFEVYFALVLMIIAVIMVTDVVSEQVRHRLFGAGGGLGLRAFNS